jgi:hypothetical protein
MEDNYIICEEEWSESSHLNRLLAALQVTDEAHHAPLAVPTGFTD